jgi:hypothetical protein
LPCFETVYVLTETESKKTALSKLGSALIMVPHFFKSNFPQLIELLTRIFWLPHLKLSIKSSVLSLIVDHSSLAPHMYRKAPTTLRAIVEMIFSYMSMFSSVADEAWMRPP